MRAQILLCIVIGTCWLGVQAIPDPKFFLIETKGTYKLTPYIKGSVVRPLFSVTTRMKRKDLKPCLIFCRKFTDISNLCPLFGMRLNFVRVPQMRLFSLSVFPDALIFFRRIKRR
jgi:hypothetical protein